MAAAGVVLTPGYVQGMGLGAVFKPEATVAGVGRHRTACSACRLGLAPWQPGDHRHDQSRTALQDTKCSGLAFSDSGSYLASSHGNGVISVYSGETGAKAGEFHSQEFGCRLITYTVRRRRTCRPAKRNVRA